VVLRRYQRFLCRPVKHSWWTNLEQGQILTRRTCWINVCIGCVKERNNEDFLLNHVFKILTSKACFAWDEWESWVRLVHELHYISTARTRVQRVKPRLQKLTSISYMKVVNSFTKAIPNGFPPCRIAWSMHEGCRETFRKRKNTRVKILTLSESRATSQVHGSRYPAWKTIW
jgi:hypothetical protein